MMGEIDISTLTSEQYFKLIEEPGTMHEMKRKSKRNSKSYFPTKYDDGDVGSFHLEKSRTSDYPHYVDDAKIDDY
nr:hypothetical protein [Tanacetum cinerariifolium]